jgi:hypothetical protein
LRHILMGDLRWKGEDGTSLPVAGPPEPPVEAQADLATVPRGIRFAAQPGKKLYEARISGPMGGRVIREGGMYRSWWLAASYARGKDLGAYSTAVPESVEIGYAESQDGFAWVEKARCPLGVGGQTSFDGATFFMDPIARPEERYKAVYMACAPPSEAGRLWEGYARLHPRYRDPRITLEQVRCLYAAVSADGLHWEPVKEPLMVHFSDTDTTVRYDSWLERYVMYTRLYPNRRRTIAYAESEDFYHWTPVQPLIWAGMEQPLAQDLYLNAYSGYPQMPQYHLMFPMVYDRYTQRSWVELYTSVNGLQWNRVPGGPVVEPGEGGAWDREFIHLGKDLVPLEEGVAAPYSGTPYPHKYPRWQHVLEAGQRSWVQWAPGRLCALGAEEEGEFWTVPLERQGRELRLNARTRRAGQVRVGVAGVEGRSVEDCAPVVGDGLSLPVHWRGETSISGTGAVQLHFRMRAAELFGMEWR